MKKIVLAAALAAGAGFGMCAPQVLAQPAPAVQSDAVAAFRKIADTEWAWRQKEVPQRGNQIMPDVSAAAEARRLAYWVDVQKQLAAIDVSKLPISERTTYAVYKHDIDNFVEDGRFKLYEMPFNADSSFWAGLAGQARRTLTTTAEYEQYLTRLRGVPKYYDDQIANMRAGIKRGFTQPRETLAGRDASIAAVADVTDAKANLFYEPFNKMPASIPAADQARLRAEAETVIGQSVIPAHQKLLTFWRQEYLPKARTTLGASSLPDGKAFYQSQIRQYTTTTLTPDQIHEIGLKEVARIKAEMEAIKDKVGFKGDLAAFNTYLKTDPQFKFDKPEHLLWYGAWIIKKVDGQLPRYFGTLNETPFTLIPVPDNIAPFYTAGRGGNGSCMLNTYDLPSRPKYNIAALTVHECNPGHAFQGIVQRNIKGLPPYRTQTYISAYGEGWGLYTETLGVEMGVYETPYDDFGRLSYEMWRAARLVIDTGVHAKGWTRKQAIDYLASHTALSDHEVTTEVDRYITWPGQALSYKLGHMEILRLRAKAEAELGAKFDIKAFHDRFLSLGVATLPALAEEMDAFIAEQKTKTPAAR
ncbi:DUF885 family protein [Caulobacter segnis]|uniref:DUF885 domain-containing protein n=1 Tax=Caulobacter segnis TaxID=88688 RepID=UPI00240F5FCB|nr:DUF885 family protein [Caulobacter segnis]MDG2522190.1 DUF885 family protein [Caulobacter segnis]